MKLTSDLIYDAALDDELFAQLPSIIADSLGARSCVLHWRHGNGASEISTHSGYFSDAQMTDYAVNFANHDLWTDAGMRQERQNQAWKTSDLVAAGDYEMSVFYNEWIRAMGDDTFHCCGSVMRTVHGHGIIGAHRGKTQHDFSKQTLSELNQHVNHLRRMFAVRGSIASLSQRHDLLSEIFETRRQPVLMLNAAGRVLMANAAGEAFLRDARFLRQRNGQVRPVIDDSESFDVAVAAASRGSDRRASDCILRARDGGIVIASFLPLNTPSPQSTFLLTVETPRERLPRDVVAQQLQAAYGLTAAEVDVALRLADGQTIRTIGDERRSATGTVRTQVKHILLKMDAKRQVDLVRTVNDMLSSRFPAPTRLIGSSGEPRD